MSECRSIQMINMNGQYWPITTKVTNAVHSDYSAGFTPDYDWNEFYLAQNPEDTLSLLGSSVSLC